MAGPVSDSSSACTLAGLNLGSYPIIIGFDIEEGIHSKQLFK